MNTQHALILTLVLMVAIGTILFFIRLYLKRRKYSSPKITPHDEKYIPLSKGHSLSQSNYYKSNNIDHTNFQHSSLDNPTPKSDDMFDALKYSSSAFDTLFFGGGDFGGAGAGDSYSSDSGSWSDSSSSDSASDSGSSSSFD